MIIVRNIFHLKYGRAKEAKASMKQGIKIGKAAGFKQGRVLFDVTGRFYTMVLENSFESLADFEASQAKGFANKKWEEWYHEFLPLVENGYREIFTVVEL